MALSNSRGPARRPKPSTPPAAPASPEPAAGAGAAEAPSARRAARRRAAPRRPARRGEDGIPFGLVRIGVIVAVLAIVGVIKLATAKPAGDAHYWHALVKFDEKMGRELFLMPGELRRRVNALPLGGVSDPRLREYHGLLLKLADIIDGKHADDPDAESKAEAVFRRMDQLADQLNAAYKYD